MNLYIIVWQEEEGEPDWCHVVAKNLTEPRAKKYVKKYLADEWDNPDPTFTYFWHTPISTAEGISSKNRYNIALGKEL
jgi:hypothetical protein